MYKNFFKRLLDIIGSLIGIIICAIPMIIIAIIIKIDSKGPIFFKQERCGIYKKPFTIIKFRSMPADAPKDVPTDKFDGEAFLTKFQKLFRRSSLDEIPQLFNIFVGSMSFVGPRPALFNQEYLLELRDKNGSNNVKPGLTGWAQINGRDELNDDEKANFDGIYAQNISFKFDLKCFLITFLKVINCDGFVEGGKKNK